MCTEERNEILDNEITEEEIAAHQLTETEIEEKIKAGEQNEK